MSALVWNYQGLANPCAIRVLKDLVQEKRPSLIFLIETLAKEERLEWVITQLGYDEIYTVECEGHSSGLAMILKTKDTVQVLGSGRNFTDIRLPLIR